MLLFIEWLSKALALITEEEISKYEPKNSLLKEGERELTTLNDEEKRTFVLAEKIKGKIGQLAIAHSLKHKFNEGSITKEECERFWQDSFKIFKDSHLIKTIFWKSVEERVRNHTDTLEIRKGWKVIAMEEKRNDINSEAESEISTIAGFPKHMCN